MRGEERLDVCTPDRSVKLGDLPMGPGASYHFFVSAHGGLCLRSLSLPVVSAVSAPALAPASAPASGPPPTSEM